MENQVDENSTSNASKVLFIVVIALIVFVIAGYALTKTFKNDNNLNTIGNLINESDSNYELYDTSSIKSIDLDKAKDTSGNVNITSSGTYVLNGTLNGSIVINTTGIVALKLNGITVNSDDAAIINSSAEKLILVLEPNTKTVLKNSKGSEHEATIYSKKDLYIQGTGSLEITESEKNAIYSDRNVTIHDGNIFISSSTNGIWSEGKFTINNGTISLETEGLPLFSKEKYLINGGTFLALGNGDFELPGEESKQNVVTFFMIDEIEANNVLSFASEKEAISFTSNIPYRTVAFSTPNIINGTYYLYKDCKTNKASENNIYGLGDITYGSKISFNDQTEFVVNSSNSYFGILPIK